MNGMLHELKKLQKLQNPRKKAQQLSLPSHEELAHQGSHNENPFGRHPH